MAGSEPKMSFCSNASDSEWFTDFIAFETDDSFSQDDLLSVSETSESSRVDSGSGMDMTLRVASSPSFVRISADNGVPNHSDASWCPLSTELDEADYLCGGCFQCVDFAVEHHKASPQPLPLHTHSENVFGEGSNQFSLEQSRPAQDEPMGRVPVPRTRYFQCPTCKSFFSGERRLSEHLRKSHAPARFGCGSCNQAFKHKKDLKRHQLTHGFLRKLFACSCGHSYARYDGLLRHITEMTRRPQETVLHKAAESNQY